MARPGKSAADWAALKDQRLVPADVTPKRDIGRWVDGELWYSVCVHKRHDELNAQVWVGVADFLESLGTYGRMGVDVRIGEDWEAVARRRRGRAAADRPGYAPALAAVTSPYDILDAVEAGVLERDGIRIGKQYAGRPANIVSAGDPGRPPRRA